MDTLMRYRQTVERILLEHTRVPYAYGEIDIQPVFDRERDHYLVVLVGRNQAGRVHGCLIHVDIAEERIWVQRDGTEYGVARELLDAGIPEEDIVLGFRSPEARPHNAFAVI